MDVHCITPRRARAASFSTAHSTVRTSRTVNGGAPLRPRSCTTAFCTSPSTCSRSGKSGRSSSSFSARPKMALVYLALDYRLGMGDLRIQLQRDHDRRERRDLRLVRRARCCRIASGQTRTPLVRNMLGLVLINVLLGVYDPEHLASRASRRVWSTGFLLGMMPLSRPAAYARPIAVQAQSQGAPVEAELLPPQQPPHQ